jgi:capsular polysaccharide biosynthesis protein
VLAKDVESAQRAFDATSQRFSQTRIEGASDQSDISVLNPAVAPIDPSSPKVLLNIVLSVFVGGMLGVGAGVLAELVDRRVRSGADLADALQLPVLGVVDWSQSGGANKPRRLINSVIPRRLRFN